MHFNYSTVAEYGFIVLSLPAVSLPHSAGKLARAMTKFRIVITRMPMLTAIPSYTLILPGSVLVTFGVILIANSLELITPSMIMLVPLRLQLLVLLLL